MRVSLLVLGVVVSVHAAHASTVVVLSDPQSAPALGSALQVTPAGRGVAIATLPPPFAGVIDLHAALASRRLGARLTAIGCFVDAGTDADRPTLRPLATLTDPVPKCAPADDCGWDRGCRVPRLGAPEVLESKPVATVGDYVRFCVPPQMDGRATR